MDSVSTSIRGVRFTLYILGGNEWVRFPRHSVSGSTLLGLTGTRGVERIPPQGAPGACRGPCFCVDFAFLAWPCTGSPKVPSGIQEVYTKYQDLLKLVLEQAAARGVQLPGTIHLSEGVEVTHDQVIDGVIFFLCG